MKPFTIGPITRTDVVRYQGASGDMNPIHHDEPFARGAGYDAPLVVGMFHAGAMATRVAQEIGYENVRGTRIRWKAQVWPGDVLTCTPTERDGEIEVEATKRDGTVVATVWVTVVNA